MGYFSIIVFVYLCVIYGFYLGFFRICWFWSKCYVWLFYFKIKIFFLKNIYLWKISCEFELIFIILEYFKENLN